MNDGIAHIAFDGQLAHYFKLAATNTHDGSGSRCSIPHALLYK